MVSSNNECVNYHSTKCHLLFSLTHRCRQAKFNPHLNATNKSYTTTSLPPQENGDHNHISLPNTTLSSQVQEERVHPITDYSKWKRIFSKYLVHPSQIVVMGTIGEGWYSYYVIAKFIQVYGKCTDMKNGYYSITF